MRLRSSVRAAIASLLLATTALAGEPLRVETKLGPGHRYVGEAIEVEVRVVAAEERPKVTPPRVEGAEVVALDESFRPIGVSGIGDVISETNLFTSRFRLTPTLAGPLAIPPFRARLDDRAGASSPLRLVVRSLPATGRPASYLRGVGRLRARSEAIPSSVRVGQPFEYRLILEGAGARGSAQPPTLPEFAPLVGLRFEPSGADLVADPPARTFRYRARPLVAGPLSLPSVAVATFDPELDRYVETRAPGISVRVVDVPRLDPAALPPVVTEGPPGPAAPWREIATAALILAVVLALVIRWRTPRGIARRLARRLGARSGEALAVAIDAGLTEYLWRAIGRPRGVLTPPEAAEGVGRAVADGSLADRASILIAGADRVRFGDDAGPGLAIEASAFFRDLAARRVR